MAPRSTQAACVRNHRCQALVAHLQTVVRRLLLYVSVFRGVRANACRARTRAGPPLRRASSDTSSQSFYLWDYATASPAALCRTLCSLNKPPNDSRLLIWAAPEARISPVAADSPQTPLQW